MKHKWKNKIEIEVGTAMPGDPLEYLSGKWKYLKCPLCFDHCTDSYWNRFHSKQLHVCCPLCNKWFIAGHGYSNHLSKSVCGLILKGEMDGIPPEYETKTMIIRHLVKR